MVEYGFLENQDYELVTQKRVTNLKAMKQRSVAQVKGAEDCSAPFLLRAFNYPQIEGSAFDASVSNPYGRVDGGRYQGAVLRPSVFSTAGIPSAVTMQKGRLFWTPL